MTFLNLKLQQRDNGPASRVVMSLNQLLEQWLTNVVKARVRPRTFKDYEALLRLYIRPVLGTKSQIAGSNHPVLTQIARECFSGAQEQLV